jgi:GT2 family glycosyltransferase
MTDISVIIVNWNTKALLLDCIESLYRTTRESSLEIIVVDNASTDGSIVALQKSFPQVQTIVNEENLGFAKANNIGIKKAQGRYVCLINSDVKVLDGALDKMHTYMESHPEIGALGPKTFFGDMQIQKNCREYPTLRNAVCEAFFLESLFPTVSAFRGSMLNRCDYASTMQVEGLSGCFMMVRREVIAQVGVFDERFFFYSEDVDWCKRIHDAGWQLVYYPDAEVIHYGNASSASEPVRFHLQMLKANWQYWRKHKSMPECVLFWLIKFTGTLGRATAWFAVSLIASESRPTAKKSAAAYGKMLVWLINSKLNGK